jgi:hypothetical protein
MRIEAEKTSRASVIACETGLFRVPRVIDYDAVGGVLTIERIPGLIGIRRAGLNDSALSKLAARAGTSLAAVHRDLRLPAGMDKPLDPPWSGKERLSYIHGDFSAENVCIDPAHPDVPVIIDWQTTQRHGGDATFDSAYFDLAWFINNWFYKPIYRLRPAREHAVAKAFLDAYAGAADGFERHAFGRYHRAFFESKIKARKASMSLTTRALFWRGHASWDSFVQREASGNGRA